jgi:hypothetical protein
MRKGWKGCVAVPMAAAIGTELPHSPAPARRRRGRGPAQTNIHPWQRFHIEWFILRMKVKNSYDFS